MPALVVFDLIPCVVKLLQHVQDWSSSENASTQHTVEQLKADSRHLWANSEIQELKFSLHQVQQRKDCFTAVQGKIPNLCLVMRPTDSTIVVTMDDKKKKKKKRADTAIVTWDMLLRTMHKNVEDDLTKSLLSYASACQEHCLNSLADEPNPRADGIAQVLKNLSAFQSLDVFFCNTGAQPFAAKHQTVIDAVKHKFNEVRDAFGRDVRNDRIAIRCLLWGGHSVSFIGLFCKRDIILSILLTVATA